MLIKKLQLKTWVQIGVVLLLTLFIARPFIEQGLSRVSFLDNTDYKIDFIDDSGYRVKMEEPADRIISLYSAHTENLYALGLDREIIGVGTADIYPYQVLEKEVFDYRSDPEKVIAANPDLIIIRPFIERNSPDFVNSLRRAGLTVVSLYPDNYDEFETYINHLALLTGKERTAKEKLTEFYNDLEAIEKVSEMIDSRVGVYFESSDREYKTVTENSMAARAIHYAGGINVATDAIPIEVGSSIAVYGIEKILSKGNEIDVYVTQRGVMGAGGNLHSISIRPGFDAIQAVKDEKVFEINQKIISSPTFRYVKGVKELQRAFYPELFIHTDFEDANAFVSREILSEILVIRQGFMNYVPTSSYYKDEKVHYYGDFVDVTTEYPYFDFIETAINKSYFKTIVIDEENYFKPEQFVTREEFARILYLISDLKNDDSIKISDKEVIGNIKIVNAVVAAGLMTLDDGYFNPNEPIIYNDLSEGLGL